MGKAERNFRLYRYQFSTVTRDVQGDFLMGIESYEDLIERKNEIFLEVLNDINEKGYKYRRSPISHKAYQYETIYMIQLAANRPLKRMTKEFVEEEIDNWPALTIAFDNRPNKQYLIIETKQEAFRYTNTVADMLEKNLNRYLKKYQLSLQIEPLFREEEFWRIVRRGKVQYLKFYIVAPNLSDLSKTLSEDLKRTIKQTNSNKAQLHFYGSTESGLQISDDDKDIGGLVEYMAGGGGKAHVKIVGTKMIYKTQDDKRTISIDEIYFEEGFDPKLIGKMLKAALDDVQEN